MTGAGCWSAVLRRGCRAVRGGGTRVTMTRGLVVGNLHARRNVPSPSSTRRAGPALLAGCRPARARTNGASKILGLIAPTILWPERRPESHPLRPSAPLAEPLWRPNSPQNSSRIPALAGGRQCHTLPGRHVRQCHPADTYGLAPNYCLPILNSCATSS